MDKIRVLNLKIAGRHGIYEFEKGEIKAQGKYDELKEKSPSFAEMINITKKIKD